MIARRFAFFLSVALLAGAPVFADGPRIASLKASAQDEKVSVSFELLHAFDVDELNKALRSGLPTGFTFHVEFIRKRRNWFDSKLNEATLQVICTYDSRTREYLLNYRRDGRLVRSETYSDLAKLQTRMSHVSEPDLFEIEGQPLGRLRVRVRADFMRGYLLYVIPVDMSTNWKMVSVSAKAPVDE